MARAHSRGYSGMKLNQILLRQKKVRKTERQGTLRPQRLYLIVCQTAHGNNFLNDNHSAKRD